MAYAVFLFICSIFLMISQLQCVPIDHNGVRDGPKIVQHSNGVREFKPSDGTPVIASEGPGQEAKPSVTAEVSSTSENTDGSNASSTAIATNAASGQAVHNTRDPNSFAGIRDEFVGGMTAIRDSTGKLIGFAANTVKEGVVAAVRPVVDFGANVVNKTVQIKDNIGNAGSQLVQTWGTSLKETGNITSQLVHNVAGR